MTANWFSGAEVRTRLLSDAATDSPRPGGFHGPSPQSVPRPATRWVATATDSWRRNDACRKLKADAWSVVVPHAIVVRERGSRCRDRH